MALLTLSFLLLCPAVQSQVFGPPLSTTIQGPSCGTTVGIVEKETEGPFWLESVKRSNITENRIGVPLDLVLTVFDTSKCNSTISRFGTIPRAQVDIWHCDAQGLYSGIASEGTWNQKWLRGYQMTNKLGKVRFRTIFPGWYEGRTVHIHVRLRLFDPITGNLIYNDTTQIYFPLDWSDYVLLNSAPYRRQRTQSTKNYNDMIFSSYSVVSMSGNLSGLKAQGSLFYPFVSIPNAFPFGLPG